MGNPYFIFFFRNFFSHRHPVCKSSNRPTQSGLWISGGFHIFDIYYVHQKYSRDRNLITYQKCVGIIHTVYANHQNEYNYCCTTAVFFLLFIFFFSIVIPCKLLLFIIWCTILSCLSDYIARYGRMTEDQSRVKFWQILSAVEYCHNRNIVHRDLKVSSPPTHFTYMHTAKNFTPSKKGI